MKTLSNLLRRLKRPSAKSKKGSSLAFVMAIGAALVIWVMCIMPLMATTGTITYETMTDMNDYLGSRSAIEFCKSELEDIIQTRVPYTFAVTGSADDKSFTAIPKQHIGGGTNTNYTALISIPDPLDDHKDEPKSSSANVSAICAVEPSGNTYAIQITTWVNGVKDLTYNATFTPRGSLRIFPEAYGSRQALPLSDFVLVDGQLGKYDIWDSTITIGNSTNLDSISETLKPWILPTSDKWSDRYANAGRFPAVLKTTALAALGGEGAELDDPVTNGELTDDEWIVPVGIAKSTKDDASAGSIWIEGDKVWMIGFGDSKINITDRCTVYYNGVKYNNAKPTKGGVYQISVDFEGYTDDFGNSDPSDDLRVLAYDGLGLPDTLRIGLKDTAHQLSNEEKAITVKSVEKVEIRDQTTDEGTGVFTLTVTLSDIPENSDDLIFGCLSSAAGATVSWQPTNVFTDLPIGDTYYFYVCRPASIDENGVFHNSSEVAPAGAIYLRESLTYATNLEPNQKYLIINSQGTRMMTAALDAAEMPTDEGYVKHSSINGSEWTVTGSTDNWTFKNGSYLTLYGERELLGSWDYYVDTVANTYSENTGSTSMIVKFNNTNAKIYTAVKYGLSSSTSTLSFSDNTVSASRNGSNVKFIKVPAHPTVLSPSATYTLTNYESGYATNPTTYVQNRLDPNHEVTQLYINSMEAPSALNAGLYNMIVATVLEDGTTNTGIIYNKDMSAAGTLKINRANLEEGVLSVTAVNDGDDELTVHVTAGAWHDADKGGQRYFGYRKLYDRNDTEFHWFPAESNSKTFRLDYGEYVFAVRESGTKNYNSAIAETADPITIEPRWVDLSDAGPEDFVFTYDGVVTWYELPDKILPSRVQLVFGKDDGTWSTEHTSDTVFYGVVVTNTMYGDMQHVLRISTKINITTVNGHQTSMLRGSSLYFMDDQYSIDTFGNSIYLTTDLLVLRSPIKNGGKVIVEPYTRGDGTDYTLLVNSGSAEVQLGSATLAPYTVYKIDAYKDLNALTNTYLNTSGRRLGRPESESVKYLFRQGAFDEINLDIAYADDAQLAAIVSGETVGWTNKGKLGSNNADKQYYKNAVCAYVSEITSNANNKNYTANRILIAGETDDGQDALVVPYSLSFAIRYLSLDTGLLKSENNSKFIVNNLAPQDDILSIISNWLKMFGYISKSLQVDYERSIQIIPGAENYISAQICRYDDGTDLFASPVALPLTITYPSSELGDYFKKYGNEVLSTVKIVDRYISISGDIDLSALGEKTLYFYTNYIHFDSSVDEVDARSGSAVLGGEGSKILINSQEAGYGDKEYLYFFNDHSDEKYKGTLVYLQDDIVFRTKIWDSDTVSKGFYYIYATKDGTNLLDLLDLYPRANSSVSLEGNTEMKPYRVFPEELASYSIYVNEDGTLSDAYVDTGLEDNNSTAVGGFSGGNMG